MSIFDKIDFALVTSNSLLSKVPNWSSYESMSEAQFLDLVEYSKELVSEEGDHKITFLVVAQGNDEVEDKENLEKEEALKAVEEANLEKQKSAEEKQKRENALRSKSKTILNSIYGV